MKDFYLSRSEAYAKASSEIDWQALADYYNLHGYKLRGEPATAEYLESMAWGHMTHLTDKECTYVSSGRITVMLTHYEGSNVNIRIMLDLGQGWENN